MFEKGDCFLIETNCDDFGCVQSHLFVTILEINENEIVLVNIDKTNGKSKYDNTVILKVNEGHEFITETSFVNYHFAYKETKESLESKIKEKIAKHKGTMCSEVVEKIKCGVLKSKKTPYEIRDIFEDMLYSEVW
jgi:hypothetical protein